MSNEPHVRALVRSVGTLRTLELADGSLIERRDGSASWRNNNPGNLKFEFAGSADRTVRNPRSREAALHYARRHYDGVVGLDQWGNAVFESLEAGRTAQLHLLQRRFRTLTVEQMLQRYSTADYSGATHHAAQAATIHRTAAARGQDLHGKTIGTMTPAELDALGAGIARFEGFRVGRTVAVQPAPAPSIIPAAIGHPDAGSGPDPASRPAVSRPHGGARVVADAATSGRAAPASHGAAPPDPAAGRSEPAAPPPVPRSRALHHGQHGADVRALQQALNEAGARDAHGHRLREDGRFGGHTREALIGYQASRGLPRTGVAAELTWDALRDRRALLVDDPAHPEHLRFCQVRDCVHAAEARHGVAHGVHSDRAAGALLAQVRRDGLERVDRVELSLDGWSMRAVQVHPLGDAPGLNRSTTPIDTAQAATQPLEHSTRQLADARSAAGTGRQEVAPDVARAGMQSPEDGPRRPEHAQTPAGTARHQDALDTSLALRGHPVLSMAR